MYEIIFYKDKHGHEPIYDYMQKLSKRKDKDSRIKLNKIQDYIQVLNEYGTRAGEPYVKHIENDIWELRPLRDRIFFFSWKDNQLILLHHFMKKTQKTPQKEIDQAKRNMRDFMERSINNG